ncbi:MAG: hypothetical protein LBR75_06000, partial [Prevotellaceae bacterium]|nr:hypothetical protein [Prevotellaceae bacterium]
EKKAEKIIRKNNISMIMASASSLYTLPAAHKLSRKYNIPLVVDLRDIFEQSSNNELVINKRIKSKKMHNFVAYFIRKKLTRQRNKILRKAGALITVSPWHVETLSKYNSNVRLIYNGYNSEIFYPQTIENKKFTLTFTGRLYSADMCDPSLLFEAVKNLSNENKISPGLFRLQFYLKDDLSKQIIRSFTERYEVSAFVDILDTVQNSENPQILNSSAIFLLLSNQAKDHKGIMGTKIFEYLAVEKPVLCVRSDKDCLEQTINAANAGLAASTVEETEKFILEKFSEWKQNGYTRQAVNREYIQQFSRKEQAGQFVKLFNELP